MARKCKGCPKSWLLDRPGYYEHNCKLLSGIGAPSKVREEDDCHCPTEYANWVLTIMTDEQLAACKTAGIA